MSIKNAIQKTSNFAVYTLACGAVATDPTGISAASLGPAIANSLTAAGDVFFHFLSGNEKNTCSAKLKKIRKKVEKDIRQYIPATGEISQVVSRSMNDFDENIQNCLPAPEELVEMNFDAHKVVIALLEKLSKVSDLIKLPKGELVQPERMDVPNQIIHKMLIDTFTLVLNDSDFHAFLSPAIATEQLSRLSLIVQNGGEILDLLGDQKKATAELKSDFDAFMKFDLKDRELNKLADKAGSHIRCSKRQITDVEYAVEILIANV